MTTTRPTDVRDGEADEARGVETWRICTVLARLLGAADLAQAVIRREEYREEPHNVLAREALADVLRRCRQLDTLLDPLNLDVPVPGSAAGRSVGRTSTSRFVHLVQPRNLVAGEVGQNDGDAGTEEKPGVDVLAGELDCLPRRDSGVPGTVQSARLLAAVDLEGLPGVVHAHVESSSADRSSGADDTGSLASTVEAAADSTSSSAGRAAGGRRSRGWLIRRLRGRSPGDARTAGTPPRSGP